MSCSVGAVVEFLLEFCTSATYCSSWTTLGILTIVFSKGFNDLDSNESCLIF